MTPVCFHTLQSRCGASVPVVSPEPVARFDVASPKDPAHSPLRATPVDARKPVAVGKTADDLDQLNAAAKDAVLPAAPCDANDDTSPQGAGPSAVPSAPSGVGSEGAGAGAIAYDEAEDMLEWGHERFGAEELSEHVDCLNQSAVRHAIEEWLPLVREDAVRFSSAYETLRTTGGGPEALDELAHECAAIRQKVLEDREETSGANASFDRGEGEEVVVDNFWNEPFFLLVSAAKVYAKFAEWVASIAKQAGADGAHIVCFKPMASAAQKARRPAWQGSGAAPSSPSSNQGRGWGSMVDLVRGSIVVDSWDGVLRCLQLVRGNFDVEILRVRNRFTATADVPQVWGGYRHVALTVRLLGHGHVCELLVHHRQLFGLRTTESDDRFHKFRDALAWSQTGGSGVETFTQLLSPRSPASVA